MQSRIEPPILLSRLLMFVFAAALVMLLVLVFVLYNMFPLNHPQVFFLMTQPRDNLEIQLFELPPADENLDIYKRGFIREYIKARNEIIPNASEMRKKWNNENSVIKSWSTPQVYDEFTQTDMWTAWMNDVPDFVFTCPVEFNAGAVAPRAENTYAVTFSYFCTNNDGQVDKKDYTIVIRLEMDDMSKLKWTDRLNNPLGMRVAEYTIESGNGDPLNTGYLNN